LKVEYIRKMTAFLPYGIDHCYVKNYWINPVVYL
jgi:hypothetical protein